MAATLSPCPPLDLLLLLGFLYLMASLHVSYSADADFLLEFKATISDPAGKLQNWNPSSTPCIKNHANWTGIICDSGAVLGLQLENMNLSGNLNLDVLTGVSSIRTLSFMNNNFEGTIPTVGKLGALRSIYLSRNKLSGEIRDDEFKGMGSLRKVYLSQNEFTGTIPSSLTSVPKLVELRLDDNNFSGQIPDLRQQGLALVNVSYNNLDGSIPDSLSNKDASLFAGNKGLCGPPLRVACKSSKKKLSMLLVIAIILIAIAILLAVAGMLRLRGHEKTRASTSSSKKPRTIESYETEKLERSSAEHGGRVKKAATEKEHEQGELFFVREDGEKFELQDLLRASAEVLGNGNIGSSYKAILLNGPSMVVKRFKEMNGVSKEDFQEHMRRLGTLSHPNLLPLVAYYYIKQEKLLVSEYVPNGSLANLLHGNRDSSQHMLDWPTRLRIVKGVARGLAYLYNELPMLSIPHGHLKSSNVLVDDSFEPLLTDYALVPVMNQGHAAQTMVAYKSPECTNYGRTSRKSDVWSLGILVLEVLTGKLPANYLPQGRGGTDLASWVNSVVREEWTGEVFDSRMKGTSNGEGGMLKLLQIGLGCCEANVEQRWDMKEALEKIEELREWDNDDENPSSYVSEGGLYSSRAMTEDDFSFSTNN